MSSTLTDHPGHGSELLSQNMKQENSLGGFWSLFVTQFQGAFSDNLFKWLVIFTVWTLYPSEEVQNAMVALIGAIFAVPFILFSMAGGYLADRYSKRTVAIGTKVAEVGTMVLGLIGLALVHIPILLTAVLLMSTQSAFFGPTKYGLLPEILPKERLSWGNGILSLGTFAAAILGLLIAGFLSSQFSGRPWWSGVVLVALALIGLATSLGISRVPPAAPGKRFRWNMIAEFWAQVRVIGRQRVLFLAVLGSIYFWFLAGLLQLNIFFFGKLVYQFDDMASSYLQATLAVGIGLGSVAAGYLSGNKIEYGLVPLGAAGLAVFGLIPFFDLSATAFAVNLGFLGFSAGFYYVPIMALIQRLPAPEEKGMVLGASAVLSFVGLLFASGVFYLLRGPAGMNPQQIFLAGSIMTLSGTAYLLWLLPDALMRFLIWMLTHTFYRVHVKGRDNIPAKGGVLFVSNHLSMADAFFLIGSTDRHIRFLIYKGQYEKWWVKPIARMLRSIPISAEVRPREMIKSLQEATNWIKEGQAVCIFAEGQITRIGQMMPFRKGMNRIMKGVDAPIIPVHLDNVWGSIFSFEKGRFYSKMPRQIPYPITVSYGPPMPADTRPYEVRQVVTELGASAWEQRKSRTKPLHRAFVRTARSSPFRFAMCDSTSPRLNFISALTKTIYLGRRLKRIWGGQKMVGILLPPSVPGALVNFAALLMGKVPVNLNYTLSKNALASCIEQCDLKNVLTSKKFLDHLKLKVSVRTVLLEDVAGQPGALEKASAAIAACLFPVAVIEKWLGREEEVKPDDLATVIFSSGSTGEPKGVRLSHFNIVSNIEQLGQIFAFGGKDRFLGVLPFFHSFGFTGTLGAPAVLGVGVAYHVNPLDARVIGELVRENEVTFLLATPTFLQIYMRGCQPEQFGSIQFAMVGAEKLPERLAVAFEDRFGLRPMEAYGCTECSPAVTVNSRDFRAAGFRQVGGKRGTIGHPLPGISVRIIDLDSGEELPAGKAGMMLVKGPNVMLGYLGMPEKTADVLQDGWYTTGDIAAIDEDGFVTITDRLSRFSKIGGEMVPHIKVEEMLHELAAATEQTFAVTGLPDEKKGEKLVVLHTMETNALAAAVRKLGSVELPNLWKPRKDQFLYVDQLPYLGTGKLDLRRVRELAAQGLS